MVWNNPNEINLNLEMLVLEIYSEHERSVLKIALSFESMISLPACMKMIYSCVYKKLRGEEGGSEK